MSKFYLRHFANEDDRVTTVLLPGERSFLQSVGDASVQNHFYTAIGRDGLETDTAERAFNEIEGPASEAWKEIAAGVWPLRVPEREAAAAWFALHLLRGAGARTMMSNLGTDLLQLEIVVGGRARLRETLRELGEPYDDDWVTREWISLFEDPLIVEVNANHHLSHIVEVLPRVTESLLDRWWVLTSFQRKALATCDHPVYVVPNPTLVAVGMGTGIENADTIHVPLTRRRSLAMALRTTLPPELATQTVDRQQQGVVATALYGNSCTVNSARRALFHHPDDDPLKGLELHATRTRELGSVGDPWRFMPDEDRQVLLDAGLRPDGDEGSTP